MASSEARIKANAKYNAKKIADGTNKRLGLTIKAVDFDFIDQHCAAARYCIENNIDLKE